MDCTIKKELARIAKKHIPELAWRDDLEQHYSDSEDFFETSVWSLEEALMAAYLYGFNRGQTKHKED